MVHAKGITVEVIVDGTPLKEYIDDDAEGTAQSSITRADRYVESEIGKSFTIKISCDSSAFNGYKILSGKIFVDGIEICRPIIDGDKPSTLVIGPHGKIKNRWQERPMIFADVKSNNGGTADDKPNEVKEISESLGMISVKLYRARGKCLRTAQSLTVELKDHFQPEEVSEKALKGKALDLKTRLGKLQRTSSIQNWRTDRIDDDKNPYLIFNLKYRSCKALQSMQIIPRTPSPVPEPPRPIASLSTEELMASLSREDMIAVLERRAAQMSVKSEAKSESKREVIKRERDEEMDEILASAQPSNKKRKSTAEVVDLLDD